MICCRNNISFLWEQTNKLWEQDIILREQTIFFSRMALISHRTNLCFCIRQFSHDLWSKVETTGARGTELPPLFFNFLFTFLFSIKNSFFIISSLFPYCDESQRLTILIICYQTSKVEKIW